MSGVGAGVLITLIDISSLFKYLTPILCDLASSQTLPFIG